MITKQAILSTIAANTATDRYIKSDGAKGDVFEHFMKGATGKKGRNGIIDYIKNTGKGIISPESRDLNNEAYSEGQKLFRKARVNGTDLSKIHVDQKYTFAKEVFKGTPIHRSRTDLGAAVRNHLRANPASAALYRQSGKSSEVKNLAIDRSKILNRVGKANMAVKGNAIPHPTSSKLLGHAAIAPFMPMTAATRGGIDLATSKPALNTKVGKKAVRTFKRRVVPAVYTAGKRSTESKGRHIAMETGRLATKYLGIGGSATLMEPIYNAGTKSLIKSDYKLMARDVLKSYKKGGAAGAKDKIFSLARKVRGK